MLVLFQILFVLFALGGAFGVVTKYKSGVLGTKGAIFWFCFWIVVIGAVIWPNGTAVVAGLFGIGRGADFVFYISIAVLFYIIFTLHIKIETVSRDMTRLVRDRALESKKK